MRTAYTVIAEPDGRWWAITVEGLPGLLSQARNLAGVEPMAREAIAMLQDVPPDSFDVVVQHRLGRSTDALISAAIAARAEAADRQRIATTRSREAARALALAGLPQRDIGRLLHLSHQRVAQLLGQAREG